MKSLGMILFNAFLLTACGPHSDPQFRRTHFVKSNRQVQMDLPIVAINFDPSRLLGGQSFELHAWVDDLHDERFEQVTAQLEVHYGSDEQVIQLDTSALQNKADFQKVGPETKINDLALGQVTSESERLRAFTLYFPKEERKAIANGAEWISGRLEMVFAQEGLRIRYSKTFVNIVSERWNTHSPQTHARQEGALPPLWLDFYFIGLDYNLEIEPSILRQLERTWKKRCDISFSVRSVRVLKQLPLKRFPDSSGVILSEYIALGRQSKGIPVLIVPTLGEKPGPEIGQKEFLRGQAFLREDFARSFFRAKDRVPFPGLVLLAHERGPRNANALGKFLGLSLAHELGHLLLNNKSHFLETRNLMSIKILDEVSLELTREQCQRARATVSS